MSFLTALLGGIGAFGQGRQQQQQYNLQNQQTQADIALRQQQATLEQAKWKETARQMLAGRGVDPSTGTYNPTTGEFEGAKPFVMPQGLQRIVPHPVGTKYQPTVQDYINHYNSLASWYTHTGQSDLGDLAAKNAQGLQTELMRQQAEQSSFARAVYLSKLTSDRDFQLEGAREGAAQTREDDVTQRFFTELPYLIQGREQVKGSPTFGDIHQTGLIKSQVTAANKAMTDAYNWTDNAVTKMTTAATAAATGDKNVINQKMADFKHGLDGKLAEIKANPGKADSYIKQIYALPLTDSQKQLAETAINKVARAQMGVHNANSLWQQSQAQAQKDAAAGGSYDAGGPQFPAP